MASGAAHSDGAVGVDDAERGEAGEGFPWEFDERLPYTAVRWSFRLLTVGLLRQLETAGSWSFSTAVEMIHRLELVFHQPYGSGLSTRTSAPLLSSGRQLLSTWRDVRLGAHRVARRG